MSEFDITSIPIIGSLFNWLGVDSANNKNAEQAQLNRDFQERMFAKSMQFTENMWNKANDYNKPINQVQRLKQAGINPAFALGQVSSGVANNVGSPGTPSGAQATFQPKSVDSSQFIRLFEAQNQAKLLNSQTEKTNQESLGMQMDNNYRNAMNLAQLYKLRSEADSAKARSDIDRTIASYQDQFSQAELHAINQNNKNLEQQYEIGVLQKIEMNTRLAFLPQQLKLDISKTTAEIKLLYQQKKLTKQQVLYTVEKVLNEKEIRKQISANTSYLNQQTKTSQSQESYNNVITERYNEIQDVMLYDILNDNIPVDPKSGTSPLGWSDEFINSRSASSVVAPILGERIKRRFVKRKK